MSKQVKEMIRKELTARFTDVGSVAICGFTGLDSEGTYAMRGRLAEKDIQITVVKNSLAKQAFKQVGLDEASDLLDGPCAVAYGADSIVSVVRELLDIGKDSPALTVKGAILDGEVFSGEDDVQRLSKFPTRDEALGQLVGCVLSAGSNLSGCLVGPAGQIAGILKAIEEKAEDAA
jgi:large subunit ribosomal protein L10